MFNQFALDGGSQFGHDIAVYTTAQPHDQAVDSRWHMDNTNKHAATRCSARVDLDIRVTDDTTHSVTLLRYSRFSQSQTR